MVDLEDVSDSRMDVLAAIAESPHKSAEGLASYLDMSENVVSQHINWLREHGLVLKSQGTGGLRLINPEYEGDVDRTMGEEPDDYNWLITGNAKNLIIQHFKNLIQTTRRYEIAVHHGVEHVPKHVYEEEAGGKKEEDEEEHEKFLVGLGEENEDVFCKKCEEIVDDMVDHVRTNHPDKFFELMQMAAEEIEEREE